MEKLFTDIAKDHILEALQAFFQQQPDYTWSPDDKETRLMIVDKYSVSPDSAVEENKPALVISRGPMSWRNRVIDQFKGHGPAPAQAKQYIDVLDTSVTISCMSRQGLEAEVLASLVFGFFTFYKEELRKPGVIHDIRSAQLGPEQLGRSDSGVELALVNVAITLSLNISWSTEETNAPLLARICILPDMFNKAAVNAVQWNTFNRTLETIS